MSVGGGAGCTKDDAGTESDARAAARGAKDFMVASELRDELIAVVVVVVLLFCLLLL